jgi:hypothetical protein
MPRSERTCRCPAARSQKRRYAHVVSDEPGEVTDNYDSTRRFQMWLYEVSHSQLLLRSVKNNAHSTRVDILFKSVDSLHLPTTMDGITISRRDQGFAMSGSDWDGHVVAGACFVDEDKGEYFDPSPFASSLRQGP